LKKLEKKIESSFPRQIYLHHHFFTKQKQKKKQSIQQFKFERKAKKQNKQQHDYFLHQGPLHHHPFLNFRICAKYKKNWNL